MTHATMGHQTVYAVRRERLAGLMAGYECPAGDVFGCGVDYLAAAEIPAPACGPGGKPGRWALVVERPRHGYMICVVEQRDDVEQVAARQLMDGRQPVCFYDLDALAGESPPPMAGDLVAYLPEHEPIEDARGPYEVVGIDYQRGERQLQIALNDEDTTWCAASWVQVVDRVHDDDRMPVRYGLAKIVTTVVFNSVPTEA